MTDGSERAPQQRDAERAHHRYARRQTDQDLHVGIAERIDRHLAARHVGRVDCRDGFVRREPLSERGRMNRIEEQTVGARADPAARPGG